MRIKLQATRCRLQVPRRNRATRKLFNLQPGRRGIALVITLIMLAVTLVMAIAFIAVSRRERNAVATGTDTTTARLAAETAAAAAQAQIVANIFASTNAAAYDFGLMVSTNFITPGGITPGSATLNYLSYYDNNGNLLAGNNFNQVVTNLYYLPRVPVLITNRAAGTVDFRFYLDLNRDGQFEDSGVVTNIDNLGRGLGSSLTNVVGDPQWIGILERPDAPHSADNHFVARYAFFAQPIGNGLDLNGIHNQASSRTINSSANTTTADGYLRNQGVGGWENNLAAFLADLNTNIWGQIVGSGASAPVGSATYYQYNPMGVNNRGVAFDDARALLAYRYNFGYNLDAAATDLPFGQANAILPYDNIDIYTDGPLQLSTTNIDESTPLNLPGNQDKPGLNWVGANNPNSYYDLTSELFDPAKVSQNFVNRLQSAGSSYFGGTTNSTYDRYTFYRLLSQLGTDSSVTDTRMNLNYDNITPALNGATNINGTASATNMLAWTPLGFFTKAADRMLRYYSARWLAENFSNYTNTFGSTTANALTLTNIPVYVNGQMVYTPAVHRILQLAANLYDASTTNIFPSVFRPTFYVVIQNGFRNVYINGYQYVSSVSGPGDLQLNVPTNAAALPPGSYVNQNVYEAPWILGAKKNLPAFNQFYSFDVEQFTRKIQVGRTAIVPYNGNSQYFYTNFNYIMSITNKFGYSFWNPYSGDYTNGPLMVTLRDQSMMVLSNDVSTSVWPNSTNFYANFIVNQWPGSAWTNQATTPWPARQPHNVSSFTNGQWDFVCLPEAIYRMNPAAQFISTSDTNNPNYNNWDPLQLAHFPNWWLTTSNNLQAFIIDQNSGRIVDYVHFSGPNGYTNLNAILQDPDWKSATQPNYQWSTNAPPGINPFFLNYGILDQIKVSLSGPTYAPIFYRWEWNSIPSLPPGLDSDGTGAPESAFFLSFYTGTNFLYKGTGPFLSANLIQQAPYTPSRFIGQYIYLQANDPLVHTLYSDLVDPLSTFGTNSDDPTQIYSRIPNTAIPAPRYQPWGKMDARWNNAATYVYDAANAYRFANRDSLTWSADYWDFPNNKYPSVGWIGRVHRGTPWQTVFLKATNLLSLTNITPNKFYPTGTNTWAIWTGGNNNLYDAAHTAPSEDRMLFDLFTATLNDNARRGALAINQQNLASWSALFSGLVALTNTSTLPSSTAPPAVTNLIISPAGPALASSPIQQILNGILATRTNTSLLPQGAFTNLGDILRVPALTEQSPFLNRSSVAVLNNGISDELYEWLPQQAMGLLRLGSPRYVVVCYGQALKPAKDGTVLSGPYSLLVTNYAVVSETATRLVLRVDNATGTNGPPRVVVESTTPLSPQ